MHEGFNGCVADVPPYSWGWVRVNKGEPWVAEKRGAAQREEVFTWRLLNVCRLLLIFAVQRGSLTGLSTSLVKSI